MGLKLVEYSGGPEALRELSECVRNCNGEHRHSSSGYVSLAEFENQPAVRK